VGQQSFRANACPIPRLCNGQHAQIASHVELEAVLGNALTNITRYQADIKGDFYKAVHTLRAEQEKKCKREV